MRRDYFSLDIDADDGLPTLRVTFDGPVAELTERLESEGSPRSADAVDVGFRLLSPVDAEDGTGVLGVANRVTGQFLLELNAEAEDVLEFVRTARARQGDDARYRLVVRGGGETLADWEKGTLLVYEPSGGLLREHSLIPSGVEL
jgi:hypothetical protein